MANKDALDTGGVEEKLFVGRLITAYPGFLIGPDNYVVLKNMRYLSGGVGIETRGGTRRFNATAVGSGANIDKIFQHIYTRNQVDYADTYVVTDERKLYQADSIPESSNGSGSLGSSLYSFSSGADIPSVCQVEDVVVVSTRKDIVTYQGSLPPIDGFLVGHDIDNANTGDAEDGKTFYVWTDEVTDFDDSTYAVFTLDTLSTDNDNAFYVGFFQPIEGIKFTLGTSTNNNASTLTLQKWTGAAWSDLTITDGTTSGGATFAQTGTVSWTYDGTEKPRMLNGLMLYWYRGTVNATLDQVHVKQIEAVKPWAQLVDVSDGEQFYCTGFYHYDQSADKHVDWLAQVIDGSRGSYAKIDEITSSDAIYIGFPVRVMSISLDITQAYSNDANAAAMTVSYWDGDSWVNYASDEYHDGTDADGYSFTQSGVIRLEDKGTAVKMRSIQNSLPMYWYKLTFDDTVDNTANDEIRIWRVRGVAAPRTVKNCNWVLNFKDRLFRFGLEDAPNTAEYSAYKLPYAIGGADTSAVNPRITFGDHSEITCAVNFYNEALVFKRNQVWMMEGDSPQTFGTLLLDNTVGCVAPQTAQLVRTWVTLKEEKKDFRHAVFFQAYDGVYGCDGIRCWKLSHDIENYFDPNNSNGIKAGYRDKSVAWYDRFRNEYNIILWLGATPTPYRFVYNTELQRWAGPWEYGVDLCSGATLVDSNYDSHQYGGGTDGRLYHLECNSYNDVDSSGNNTAIDNYVELGDNWTGLLNKWSYRGIYLYGQAKSSGAVTVKMKGNGRTSAVTLGTVSMVSSGYTNFQGRVVIGKNDSSGSSMENKFQSARFIFQTDTAGVSQTLYGYALKKDIVGEAE